MKITADFSLPGFESLVNQDIIEREERIAQTYIEVGTNFLNLSRTKTRSQGGFGNITGNLRSSEAGVVIKYGIIQWEDYKESDEGTDKTTGLQKAKEYISELIAIYKNEPIALIIVAGMNYAASVEARNKDVISGSSREIEKDLEFLIKQAS